MEKNEDVMGRRISKDGMCNAGDDDDVHYKNKKYTKSIQITVSSTAASTLYVGMRCSIEFFFV